MPVLTLVSDIEKVVERLRNQYGDFTLAMLYHGEAESSWNLIVSARWADRKSVAESTHIIARELGTGLGLENRRAISRITVLRTDDAFVRDMTDLYPVTAGHHVPLANVTAGEITEGSGVILRSIKVA
jgi:hypothetical protein